MAEKKLILITGGAGEIGTTLRKAWRDTYRIRLYDRQMPEHTEDEEVVIGDITDLPAMQNAMQGVDTVIHLAADRRVSAPWDSVLHNNLEGTYTCYEAARQAGVRRVIFASSNHAMGYYDKDYAQGKYNHEILNPHITVRPDSLYGVSKAYGEALGSYYADAYGLSVICFRIGWFLQKPIANPGSWWMWLSPRDAIQLFTKAIESDVKYGVYYGVSNNTRLHWDIAEVRSDLGYDPQDNAEEYIPQLQSEQA